MHTYTIMSTYTHAYIDACTIPFRFQEDTHDILVLPLYMIHVFFALCILSHKQYFLAYGSPVFGNVTGLNIFHFIVRPCRFVAEVHQ